jgi:hypothetical protein
MKGVRFVAAGCPAQGAGLFVIRPTRHRRAWLALDLSPRLLNFLDERFLRRQDRQVFPSLGLC